MNVLLWVLQVWMAAQFGFSGFAHFAQPEGLPALMAWMYDLSPALHTFAGTVEILAALGLVLPGLLKIQTRLTPLAAAGLVLTMAGGAIWHVPRGEWVNIGMNIFLMVVLGFVAYMRWTKHPLPERGS